MDMLSFLMGKACGGTGGGSSVTVEALTATENKTYTAPEGKAYSPVTVNVPTGGGGWTKIATTEFTVNTSSTSVTDVGTVALDPKYYSKDYILWIHIRDKAGKREGYFLGTDSFILNNYSANGMSGEYTNLAYIVFRYVNSKIEAYTYAAYGVYPYSITSNGTLAIKSKYQSTYTKTIDGTFTVDVYAIEPPSALFS